MGDLMPGLVDQGGRPQQIVADDLDGGHGADVAPIPQAQSCFQDGRPESFVHVGQGDRRRLVDLVKEVRHAAMSQRVAGSQKGGQSRIGPPVDGIGKEVQGRFRPEVLSPEREQFPANLGRRGGAVGGALQGGQCGRLRLQTIDDARQVAPQGQPQIAFEMAPRFRRRQVIKLQTRGGEHPMRNLSLGLRGDRLDPVSHTCAPARCQREYSADHLCRWCRQPWCSKDPCRPGFDRAPSVPAGSRS